MAENIIMYDSPEAAHRGTVEGWFSRDGFFYGDGETAEHVARSKGCTHNLCEDCGAVIPQNWRTVCATCRAVRARKGWEALPAREWDGTTPVTEFLGDRYFFSDDEFEEWCESEEIDPASVMLVHCRRTRVSEVGEDFYCDDLAEDQQLPDEVCNAIDALNRAAREHIITWEASGERVIWRDSNTGDAGEEG